MKRGGYEEKAKASEKQGKTEEVTVSFYKMAKEGESVVGQLLGLQKVRGKESGGFYFQYLIDTDQGLLKTSFGAAYDKEMSPILHIGCVYKWTYLGKRDISNGHRVNEIKTYLVDESEAGELLVNYIEKNFSGQD